MIETSHPGIFPIAYTTTQEVGLQVRQGDGDWDEPYKLASALSGYIPPKLLLSGNLLRNCAILTTTSESKASTSKKTNITISTPECSSPSELHAYVRASEVIIAMLVENYALIESGQNDITVMGRQQNRVVDGVGSRKGARDSFAMPRGSYLSDTEVGVPRSLFSHIGSRNFITGAGLNLGTAGLRYSQKTGGLSQTVGAGYFGSMINHAVDDGVVWIESRNDDVNILDWAIRARIGGTAIMLALNNSPLRKEMNEGLVRKQAAILKAAQRMNYLQITPDGQLIDSKDQRHALATQRGYLELFMGSLINEADIPDEFLKIAKELYAYCDDYEKVLDGKETILLLKERAEWAAKFAVTLAFIARDQERAPSAKRTLQDGVSMAKDHEYDRRVICASRGKLEPTRQGKGFRLRDSIQANQRSAFTVSPKDVERAVFRPPQTTRARILADLVRHYPVSSCGRCFASIVLRDKHYRIVFPNPLQTALSEDQAETVDEIQQQFASR